MVGGGAHARARLDLDLDQLAVVRPAGDHRRRQEVGDVRALPPRQHLDVVQIALEQILERDLLGLVLVTHGDVLVAGQAAAAVADARAQEVAADPLVQAHRVGDHADVGAHLLAHVGDLVDERDLGREEGVGCVLDHLGAGRVGADDRRVDVMVKGFDDVAVGALQAADDDPVGLHEVGDRAALAKELRIRDVADVLQAARGHVGPQPLAGAHGHRALHHQHDPLVELRDAVDHAVDARQVGVAGVRGRRVDADEHHPARGRTPRPCRG